MRGYYVHGLDLPSPFGDTTMSSYQPRITKNADNSFYAIVVRIDKDGYENVLNHYKGRHFSTLKAAEKSTNNYISKI